MPASRLRGRMSGCHRTSHSRSPRRCTSSRPMRSNMSRCRFPKVVSRLNGRSCAHAADPLAELYCFIVSENSVIVCLVEPVTLGECARGSGPARRPAIEGDAAPGRHILDLPPAPRDHRTRRRPMFGDDFTHMISDRPVRGALLLLPIATYPPLTVADCSVMTRREYTKDNVPHEYRSIDHHGFMMKTARDDRDGARGRPYMGDRHVEYCAGYHE